MLYEDESFMKLKEAIQSEWRLMEEQYKCHDELSQDKNLLSFDITQSLKEL